MPDALTSSGACIDNRSIASGDDAELIGESRRDQCQVAQQRLIFGRRLVERGDVFFRNDQNVRGRLRIDIVEGEREVVFIDLL